VAIERTFAIIKPDAVGRGLQGEILSRIHKAGFQIVAIKSMRLTKEQAGGFYAVHKARPFFGELTEFMSSGKIFAMVLEAEGAILKWRDTMGATDPKKAAPGTIRHDLGTNIGNNCTHGSDAPETAAFEIGYVVSADRDRVDCLPRSLRSGEAGGTQTPRSDPQTTLLSGRDDNSRKN
jgi:nucleoside-diphosphate kinase